ncbi:sugar ABC transporter substrate-binding protein [Acidimicrobium ferrooxidans]|uniref:Sugar ABC transporter substrate-binding protein n=1 Tax=Acidimicrobium ferrooxidans TaxID=53635 RepID=A0ABS3ANW2_9ACTN|nr:sugar ABC transporter substrate-binding protein [Acidimicrobium ferrooxidans]
MKPKQTVSRLIALLLSLTLMAAACGSDDESGSAATTSETTSESSSSDETTPAADDEATPAADDEADESEPADAEPVSIRYLTFSAAPDYLDELDAMIAGFEADNPDVTVEVETLPFDDYFSVLRTQIAGDDAPDAFELNYENFVSFAAAGTLADVGALSDGADDSVYYQDAFDAFALDGTQFALPASYSTVVLFYNKELFAAAGIDEPTDDWTWADESQAAADIAALDDDTFGFFAGIHFWEFYKTAAQNGCNFFEGDAVTIDAPECVEALQYMLDFVNDGSQPTEAEMSGVSDGDMFLKGELGLLTSGIWMFDAFAEADFDWDIVVEPGNTSGGSHFFANGVAVSSASDKQEAAARWIRYFTSSDSAAQIRVEAAWELPTLTDAALYDVYLSQEPPANREAVLASLEDVVNPPVIERQGEMQDAVNAAFALAVAGNLTAEEALAQAKSEIEGLLG